VATNFAKPSGNLSTSAILTYRTDTDGDGLPDDWESLYFGATGANPGDDSDSEGMTNGQEYFAGTDPINPLSYLKVDALTAGSEGATIRFGAISNHTYTVQFTDALDAGSWSRLADVVAQSTNRLETISDLGYTSTRFYRLVTPWQP
jgi:hypothetical protein